MNLFHNPFYIIGVSTREPKQTIVEACDAKSLTVDSDLCTRCRSVLTQPRNRLSAELAWLPGLSPTRAFGLIDKIEKDSKSCLASLYSAVISTKLGEIVVCHSCGTKNRVQENRILFGPKCGKCKIPLQISLNPLARCNVLITYLDHHKPQNDSQISNFLIDIARCFDQIDYSDLLTIINEDRQIAKIPLIQDMESIKQEMQNRRDYMIGVMKNSLNNVKAPDNILTDVISKTTSDGRQHPPILIEDLTDKYQIEVQKYLEHLVDKIRNIITTVENQPKETFEKQMPILYKYLKVWEQIAQPIQIIQQSKGIDDPHSKGLAQELRGLAITMANTYEMHPEAKQITKMVAEIFKELPQFAEKVSEDLTELENILIRNTKSKEEEQKWREECSMEVELGYFFLKKRLSITPEIIRYKNEQIPTNEVTRVRWGAVITDNVYNCSILIGNNKKSFYIELSDNSLYNIITNRLWKVICVRMIGDTLKQLSDGISITFDNDAATVNKNGIILKKHKVIGSAEPIFCKWEELAIRNGNGTFIVEHVNDKSIGTELSYKDVDNVHILESVLRFLWKDGNCYKLSRGEFAESS